MSIRRTPLALATAVLAAALVPLAAPAEAADAGPVPLGMTSVARVVLDEARGHLFLSPGPSGTGVRVTDLQGAVVTTVADLPGATGLSLSPDGRSLWVALPRLGALAQVDTTTLAVTRRLPVPAGQCPGDVAAVGTRLVYGHSCYGYGDWGDYGGVGVLDAGTGASLAEVPSGPFYAPVVAAGPGGRVYAADTGLSPAELYAYDVSGPAPVLLASQRPECGSLNDLSVSPDGSQVVTACGAPYEHTVWTADLQPSGAFSSGAYPRAGAWSADGRTFVAGIDDAYGPDVFVHRLGEDAPVRTVDFGGTTTLVQARGLAASRDGSRLWAVTSTSSGELALHVLDVPPPVVGAGPTTLKISAPGTAVAGAPLTVRGSLTSGSSAVAGAPVRVTRSGCSTPWTMTGTTAPDGSWTVTDPGAPGGTCTWEASYGGSSTHAASAVTATTSVALQPSRLTLSAVRGTGRTGKQMTLTAQLTGGRTNRTVVLTAQRSRGAEVVVASAAVDGEGRLTATHTPKGRTTYRARYAGDAFFTRAVVAKVL